MVIVQCEFGGIVYDVLVKCEKDTFDVARFKKLFEAEFANQEAVMKILDPSRVVADFSEAQTAIDRAFLDMGVEATHVAFIEVDLN